MNQKKFFIVYIYLFPFFAIINLFAIQNEMKGQETVFMLVIHGIHYFFPLFFPHCQVMKQPLYFSQLINETERDILHWETEYSRRMRYQGGQGHWKLFSWQGNMATCSMEEFISLSSLKYFFLTEDTLNWREVTQMLYREIMHLGAFSSRGIFIHSCIGKSVLFLTSLWALLLGKADIWVEFCTKTCCSVLELPAEDSLNDGPLNFEELQMLWRDNVCVRFFVLLRWVVRLQATNAAWSQVNAVLVDCPAHRAETVRADRVETSSLDESSCYKVSDVGTLQSIGNRSQYPRWKGEK